MKRLCTLLSAAVLFSAAAVATHAAPNDRDSDMTCDGSWNDGDRVSHCEIREFEVKDFGGRLDVSPGLNGGVSVRGWDKNEVLVRAKVQTSADTEDQAKALAAQIAVETAGGRIRVTGIDKEVSWAVSFQIFVPRRTDVVATTTNGGIGISGISGDISFEALNGGVALRGLGGNVRGHTTNGGLSVELTGSSWDGEALDVSTINGGVSVSIPESYSARFETGTVHGQLNIGIPLTVQGKVSKQLSTTLGSGGPLVRVTTTNGGVSIRESH